MSLASRRACGLARVRAHKSRLLDAPTLAALAAVDAPAATLPGWRDLDAASDASSILALAYDRLIADCVVAMAGYPEARDVLRALVELHEIENVKLLWRAATARLPFDAWRAEWRPLGSLERVSATAVAPLTSVRQLAAALARTPYARVADAEVRAHPDDPAAVEIAFDRAGSARVLAAARALPGREHAARDLALSVVRERDVAIAARVIGALGLAPDVAVEMTAVLGREAGASRLASLARRAAETRSAVRAARRLACRRAFIGDPFSLAPPIALVLQREDEARALISLAEIRTCRLSPPDAARALTAVQ